jgi:hypothetical protein
MKYGSGCTPDLSGLARFGGIEGLVSSARTKPAVAVVTSPITLARKKNLRVNSKCSSRNEEMRGSSSVAARDDRRPLWTLFDSGEK